MWPWLRATATSFVVRSARGYQGRLVVVSASDRVARLLRLTRLDKATYLTAR